MEGRRADLEGDAKGIGGAERDRTAGLLVANEALSQLSYSPTGDLTILPANAISGNPQRPAAKGTFPASDRSFGGRLQHRVEWLGLAGRG